MCEKCKSISKIPYQQISVEILRICASQSTTEKQAVKKKQLLFYV
jgi:hypothetical protein